ncbi:hypothetical protein CTEN210_06538 [Chaetoceros tenuissimus]|uniref:RING-type domain-containing protein n=1 Tax=Chaetoceros tenuissimus TaxID=426638 RepID=A0AAD3CQ77_9STRA|nr:hypothetical protein CTEN210_06538 [Chaetoceros tenuissimus]
MANKNDSVIYLILAAVVIAFILLKYIQKIQAENRNRMISDARTRAVRILQRREMRARGTAFREMNQQEKEERRLLVLTSVLHRRVIQKDSKKDEMENESSLGTILKSALQMTSSQQEDIDDTFKSVESDGFPNKQDIVLLDESNTTKLPEKANEEYNSKICCSICLEKYTVGDEISYSKNPKCDHAFHTECISLWCIKNSLCPLCRNDFVYENGDEENPTTNNESNHDDEQVEEHFSEDHNVQNHGEYSA